MKMMYRSHTNKQRSLKLPTIVLIIVALLVLCGWYIHKSISPFLLGIYSPVVESSRVAVEDAGFLYSLIKSKGDLIAENEELKTLLSNAKNDNANLKLSLSDYDELKKYVRENEDKKKVMARVLSFPDSTPFDSIVIGAGEDVGIKSGMAVYGPLGAKIGTITISSAKTSLVRLYSSPGENTPILIGEKRVPAEAVGRGGGIFLASLPKNSAVSVGDTIILSSQPTVLFGSVEAIESTDTDSFAKIYFKNPFTFSGLRFVSVSTSE